MDKADRLLLIANSLLIIVLSLYCLHTYDTVNYSYPYPRSEQKCVRFIVGKDFEIGLCLDSTIMPIEYGPVEISV